MQKCDVVVNDRLVSNPILDLVKRDAEKMYAGKASANHSLTQESINELLVRLAKEGKSILRLKGGGPFIFGRGGETVVDMFKFPGGHRFHFSDPTGNEFAVWSDK
jgi:uroporphyrin-III C-methyltransferase/precorrin-2 dehydrogenase/sirohydrochlorin ferrochelatase